MTRILAIVRIHDLHHPLVLPYRNLPQLPRHTQQRGHFVVEGQRLVKRLLAANIPLRSVLLEERLLAEIADRLPSDIDVCLASRQLLREIVGFEFHRGMLACAHRPASPQLTDVLNSLETEATAVVCAGVQEADNLGGILRSSAALGVNLVVLGDHCADPYGRRALRVSSGSVFRLALCESPDLLADLQQLRSQGGFQLGAAVLDKDAEPLHAVCRPDRFALVLGSEAFGLTPAMVSACDRRVTIPMRPGIDSLNVSVATGIMLYLLRPGSRRDSEPKLD